MLPYKQYLLPAVIELTEAYLKKPEATYDEARCSNHVPLVHQGIIADADSTEEEKTLEEICHLAPSTPYRWVSWLDKALDALERSCRGYADLSAELNLTPWQHAATKRCTPKRLKILVRAAQALALLKGKELSTNLAMARPPP